MGRPSAHDVDRLAQKTTPSPATLKGAVVSADSRPDEWRRRASSSCRSWRRGIEPGERRHDRQREIRARLVSSLTREPSGARYAAQARLRRELAHQLLISRRSRVRPGSQPVPMIMSSRKNGRGRSGLRVDRVARA